STLPQSGAAATAVPAPNARSAPTAPAIMVFFIVISSLCLVWPVLHDESLLVFLGHAFRLVVRNSLVAVDAGHIIFLGHLVLLACALLLRLRVHALEAVAVAALTRIDRLHACPFTTCQREPLRLELLARVDRAGDLAPNLT